MAKPILRFKINQQAAEVGGKYYGIIEDAPVTPENSILQICEFKKITAFTPEQVLRLVEDVCDGAAKLVARDGQSRQISSLLKFSPRVRGTFAATDSRWTDQRLIVGARLLKDIKLEMSPSDFVMSNVADIGTLLNVAITASSWDPYDMSGIPTPTQGVVRLSVNGSRLSTWDTQNTFVKAVFMLNGNETTRELGNWSVSDFAANGFTATYAFEGGNSWKDYLAQALGADIISIDEIRLVVYHPNSDLEFKTLTIPRRT